ncbi:hypothetical protein ABPG72_017265 [Tetrahymena utriculariae]
MSLSRKVIRGMSYNYFNHKNSNNNKKIYLYNMISQLHLNRAQPEKMKRIKIVKRSIMDKTQNQGVCTSRTQQQFDSNNLIFFAAKDSQNDISYTNKMTNQYQEFIDVIKFDDENINDQSNELDLQNKKVNSEELKSNAMQNGNNIQIMNASNIELQDELKQQTQFNFQYKKILIADKSTMNQLETFQEIQVSKCQFEQNAIDQNQIELNFYQNDQKI